MEAMGYKVVKDGGKPHYQVLTMQLSGSPDRKKIAKLVVDLVLFDLELETIHECIMLHNKQHPYNHCSIKDALEARTNKKGGVQEAMNYLWQMLKGKSGEAVGNFSNKSTSSQPKNPHDQHGTASSGAISESGDFQTPNASPATSRNINATQSGSRKESSFPRIDPAKDLPPPDIDDPSVNFTSVHHTNPSSEFDDDGLIPESTHLGYRNPPETKHNPLAGHGPTTDLVTTGGYAYPPQATADPLSTKYPSQTVASSSDKERFGHPPGVSQQSRPPVKNRDDFPQHGAQAYYLRSTSHGSGDGLHSLPTNSIKPSAGNTRVGNFPSIDNQLTPTGGMTRQKSVPASPGSGEITVPFTSCTITPASTMAGVTFSAVSTTAPSVYYNVHVSTTVGNQSTSTSTTTSTNPVLVGEPVSTMSAPPKHGTLDLDNLRKKTKHFQQTTANFNVPDNPPPQHDLRDITTLKNYLDKKKDARVKLGANVNDSDNKESDYVNLDEITPSARAAAKAHIQPNKGPVAAPRYKKDSKSGIHADHPFPLEEKHEHWRCAHCEVVNGAKHTTCKKCQLIRGSLSTSHAYCKLCSLLIFLTEEKLKMSPTSTCPMCKDIVQIYTLI